MVNNSDSISWASLKLTAAKALNALFVFGGTALFTRIIGADQLGTYFLFEKLLLLFAVFSNFGLSGALEKRLSEETDRNQYFATTAVLKLCIVFVLAISIIAGRVQINGYLQAELASLLLVAVVIRETGQLFIRGLRGERRVGETSYLLALKKVSWVAVGGILSAVGFGYLGPIYGLLTGLMAIIVLGYLMVDTGFGSPSISHAKSLLQFSKYDFFSSSVGWQIYNSLDTLLIGYFLTNVAVSQYEIAWRLSMMVMMITGSISAVIFPSFSKLVEEGNSEKIENITKWSLVAGFLISIPALAGSIVMGESILGYGFGPAYVSASLVLVILVADKSSHAIQEVYAQVIRAHDRPDICAGVTGGSVVLNATGNYLLIPRFGLLGAAIATTASFAAATIIYIVVARRFIDIEFPWRPVSWQVLAAATMGLTLWGLQQRYFITSLFDTVAFVLVGILVYGIVVGAHRNTREFIIQPFTSA